jgi:hypothetical protein
MRGADEFTRDDIEDLQAAQRSAAWPRLHFGKVEEVAPEEASAAGLCRDSL